MGLIFISHSSHDNAEAVAMRDWLATQGWDDVFLDLDPAAGLAPGQRWRNELRKAGERCSAIVVLISPKWAESKWGLTEFLFAEQLGKEIFPVLIASCSLNELPGELATYQIVDISAPGNRAAGLEGLRIGLQRAGLYPGAFPWPPKDEPKRAIFRGLRVLEEKDAAIFFARDVQITKALDTIRRLRDGAPARMLAILGASGAGKSSFLRAGLLARLKRDTERFLVLPTVRPGRAALSGPTGLERALGLTGPLDGAMIALRVAELRASAAQRVRDRGPQRPAPAAAMPPTVVLPIDQAEELFVAGDEEAAAAVAIIVDAVLADPGLLLLVTIRSDSFGLLQGNPVLSGVPREPFDLPRLPPAAFKEIIEGPTRLPGTGFQIDADLTELLIRDFEGADALPLLAFTLERLITDHGEDGRIEKREYVDEMKGVGGAIRKAVEAAFSNAGESPGLPRLRKELDAMAQRTFVPGLVRIDDVAAAPKRRVALRRQLPQDALPLVDCLVNQRLLVTDTAGTEPTVEVSHEAVLRHWRELEGWIAERRIELHLSEGVSAAARDWRAAKASARQEALVHRGERLRAAERLLLWDDLLRQMGDDTVAYLAACREAETRAGQRQRRLRQLVAIALVIAIIGCVVAIVQRNTAINQARLASARELTAIARGQVTLDPELSLLLALESLERQPTEQGRDVLRQAAADSHLLATNLPDDVSYLSSPSFDSDGQRVVTASKGIARIWKVGNGELVATLGDGADRVESTDFTPDGLRVLVTYGGGTGSNARVFDATTGKQLQELRLVRVHAGALFSPDGARLVGLQDIGGVTPWIGNARTYQTLVLLRGHEAGVWTAAFSSDGKRIVTGSFDQTARVWDATTGKQVSVFRGHSDRVSSVQFSLDGRRVVSLGGGKVRVWDPDTGNELSVFDGWALAVFSPDGTRVLTRGRDKAAHICDAATGKQLVVLEHGSHVSGGEFTRDGRLVVTQSDSDGSVRVWDAQSGRQRLAVQAFTGVTTAQFNADGTRLLVSGNATARIYGCEFMCSVPSLIREVRARLARQLSPEERQRYLQEN